VRRPRIGRPARSHLARGARHSAARRVASAGTKAVPDAAIGDGPLWVRLMFLRRRSRPMLPTPAAPEACESILRRPAAHEPAQYPLHHRPLRTCALMARAGQTSRNSSKCPLPDDSPRRAPAGKRHPQGEGKGAARDMVEILPVRSPSDSKIRRQRPAPPRKGTRGRARTAQTTEPDSVSRTPSSKTSTLTVDTYGLWLPIGNKVAVDRPDEGFKAPEQGDGRGKMVATALRRLPRRPQVNDEDGAPRAIRTPDLQIRSLLLYPAELGAHGKIG
jgi:hypothetical protein